MELSLVRSNKDHDGKSTGASKEREESNEISLYLFVYDDNYDATFLTLYNIHI